MSDNHRPFLILEGEKYWPDIWFQLASDELNRHLDRPTEAYFNGHQWQYLYSRNTPHRIEHTFRHRLHPVTLKREYITVFTPIAFATTEVAKW